MARTTKTKTKTKTTRKRRSRKPSLRPRLTGWIPEPKRKKKVRTTRKRRKTKAMSAKRRNRRIKLAIILIGIIAIGSIISIHRSTHSIRIDSSGYSHSGQFADRLIVNGIDVSYVQGSHIDWHKVKKSGVDFAFIRAGYRASESGEINADSTFDRNVNKARAAGVMVGAYFYSQATSVKEARAEARALLDYVGAHSMDLPLVIDYEVLEGGRLAKYLNSRKSSRTNVDSILLAFCDTIADAGYEPGVYANYSMLNTRIHPKKIAKYAHVWLAHYANSTNYDYPYEYWQCSDSLSLNGIRNNTDQDFWYFDPDGMKTFGARNVGAKSIRKCTIELTDHSFHALGQSIEPKLNINDGDYRLREGKDYRVGYIRNIAPGTGYAVITGIGDYKDMTTTSFMIQNVI